MRHDPFYFRSWAGSCRCRLPAVPGQSSCCLGASLRQGGRRVAEHPSSGGKRIAASRSEKRSTLGLSDAGTLNAYLRQAAEHADGPSARDYKAACTSSEVDPLIPA